MSVDLLVATPTFIDLTFVGLEALPRLGEERFAGDLVRSPGGGAITAVGAARLGLSTALGAPLGEDGEGEFIRGVLRAEGVRLVERRSRRTPMTVVMPVEGDRAMVTVDPGVRADADEVAAFAPRAVAASLDQIHCVPAGAAGYITCGDEDARAFARRPPAGLSDMRALFVSQREALALTDAPTLAAAADRLADGVATVVVTCGGDGALMISDGRRVDAPALDVGAVVDTTGAGDLLVAAYVWADIQGAPPEDCLRWAVIYAGLSVTRPTAAGGAATEARLIEEGQARGLALPAGRGADG